MYDEDLSFQTRYDEDVSFQTRYDEDVSNSKEDKYEGCDVDPDEASNLRVKKLLAKSPI